MLVPKVTPTYESEGVPQRIRSPNSKVFSPRQFPVDEKDTIFIVKAVVDGFKLKAVASARREDVRL